MYPHMLRVTLTSATRYGRVADIIALFAIERTVVSVSLFNLLVFRKVLNLEELVVLCRVTTFTAIVACKRLHFHSAR